LNRITLAEWVFKTVQDLDTQNSNIKTIIERSKQTATNKHQFKKVYQLLAVLDGFGIVSITKDRNVVWRGQRGFTRRVDNIQKCVRTIANAGDEFGHSRFLALSDSCAHILGVTGNSPDSDTLQAFRFLCLHILSPTVPYKICNTFISYQNTNCRGRTLILQMCSVIKFGNYTPFMVPSGNKKDVVYHHHLYTKDVIAQLSVDHTNLDTDTDTIVIWLPSGFEYSEESSAFRRYDRHDQSAVDALLMIKQN
jgi:hypothetical protein